MLSASRALSIHDHVGTRLARKIVLRLVHVGFLLCNLWASSLYVMGLALVWDQHDLAGLERMAHVCRTRSLLHPYGMTDNATCWRALMLV